MIFAQKRRLRLPALASLSYIICGGAVKASSVITTPIVTRILSVEEYGVYALYLSWLTVFSVISTLELGGGALNRALLEHGDDRHRFTLAVSMLSAISSLIFLGSVLAVSGLLTRLTGLSSALLSLLCLQALFDGIISVFLTSERFVYGYRTVCAVNLVSATVSPAVSIMLICFVSPTAIARAVGILAVSVAVGGVLLLRQVRSCEKPPDRRSIIGAWRRILSPTLSLLPYYLTRTVGVVSDKLLITRIFGKVALGRYAVAASVGGAPSFLVGGLSLAITPWITRKLSSGSVRKIKETLGGLSVIAVCVAGAVSLFVPEIMGTIAPREYSEASFAVYLILLSVLPSFFSMSANAVLAYKKRTALTSLAAVVGVIAGIGAEVILSEFGNYTLVALGGALAQCVTFCLLLSADRTVRATLPKRRALFSFLFSFFTIALGFLLRSVMISRVILACAVALVLLCEFKSMRAYVTEK